MNKITIIITLLSLIGTVNAKNIGSGNWLLTKVIQDNKTIEVYTAIDFLDNGNIEVMGVKSGTWTYHKKNKKFNVISSKLKELNGESTVIKINDKELVLKKNSVTVYFIKLDLEKIAAENKNSGLIGAWQFKDKTNTEILKLITFKAPDEFIYIEKASGMESQTKGTWVYNKKDDSLLILGSIENMNGENRIVSLETNTVEFKNKGIVFKANKIEQNTNKIERLTFKEEDFFNANGEYLYNDDEQKLPWKDSYQMMTDLQNVQHLIYNYSTLIEDTGVFITKPLTADVKVNLEEQTLGVDFIFYGYDRYNLPEDTALPPNKFDSNAQLFPFKGDTFRVIATEKITTPAGTFSCTVVENIESDEKSKLWMANDKPGVIVRIIRDKPGRFGYYHVYELKEIK